MNFLTLSLSKFSLEVLVGVSLFKGSIGFGFCSSEFVRGSCAPLTVCLPCALRQFV